MVILPVVLNLQIVLNSPASEQKLTLDIHSVKRNLSLFQGDAH